MANDDQNRTVYLTENEIRAVIAETVNETLTKIGIEHDDPVEMQKDMAHLRAWRTSVNEVRTKSMVTVLTILIAGTLGAIWLGFKASIGK